LTIPNGGALLSALIVGVLLGGIFAITALGLSLVFGVMRLVNLVHGELLVLGAYIALVLTRNAGLDPLLTIVIVAPLMFLFAAPLHRVLLEPLMGKGPEPAMLTAFALSVIGQNAFILLWSGDTQSLQASYATASLSVGSVRIPAMYLISFAIALALCGGSALYLSSYVGIRWRVARTLRSGRLIAGLVFVALFPVALVVPAIVALALVTGTWIGLHAYEIIWWRDERTRSRALRRPSQPFPDDPFREP